MSRKSVITIHRLGLKLKHREQAIRSAESYLKMNRGFSIKGLVEQLEYEGYSHEEAVHGASEIIIYR